MDVFVVDPRVNEKHQSVQLHPVEFTVSESKPRVRVSSWGRKHGVSLPCPASIRVDVVTPGVCCSN